MDAMNFLKEQREELGHLAMYTAIYIRKTLIRWQIRWRLYLDDLSFSIDNL